MRSTIRIFEKILYFVSLIQLIAFPSIDNAIALFVTLLGWKLLWNYTAYEKAFFQYPLIALMLSSFAFFFFFFPPIVTLLEFKPVIFNLDSPKLTYFLQLVYVLALIGAFALFKNYDKNFIPRFLSNLNFYYIPTSKGIWLIGLVGLASLVFSNDHSNVLAENRSVSDRFFEGFTFMAILPLIFYSVPSHLKSRVGGSSKIVLLIYMSILIMCAVLTNRRHNIFLYLLTPFIFFIINKIHEKKLEDVSYKKIMFWGLIAFAISGPIADFALAMSIQRAVVYDIKGEELLRETWKSYQNKEALQAQKEFFLEDQTKFSAINYTEYYVDNILLNRLCNMKPIDNSVTYATKIDCIFGNDFMLQKCGEKLEYLLPSPILNIVDPSFKKFKESGYGFNDYLINVATNTNGSGFRIGGDTGIGIATFGIFFPLFVMFFYSIFFWVVNSFECNLRGSFLISMFALCKMFDFFYIFQTNHGFMDDFLLLFRTFPQEIFLYIIIINFVKLIKM